MGTMNKSNYVTLADIEHLGKGSRLLAKTFFSGLIAKEENVEAAQHW